MTLSNHYKKWLEACDLLAPMFSTCSRRQYFAVVIDEHKRVAGLGYNGAPPNMTHCVDGGCPRGSSSVIHGSSYDSPEGFCVAQHAEAGALLYSDAMRRRGATLVVNGPPCFECARLIASSGIRLVVHFVDADYDWYPVRQFLLKAGVGVVSCVRGVWPEVVVREDGSLVSVL